MKSNPERNEDSRIDPLGKALEHLALGNEDGARRSLLNIVRPSVLPQSKHRVPLRLQAQVFARDNYTCGYCGCLTVCPPALRYISEYFPELVPYDVNWQWDLTHPLYWEVCASCDHLLPVSRGGSNGIENLVTACYKCNSIKSSWLLDELGWIRIPVPDSSWNGLSDIFVKAMQASPIGKKYFTDWLRALTTL